MGYRVALVVVIITSILAIGYTSSINALVVKQYPRVVFDMEDPYGDDKGPGNYTYPTNPVFQPGVFDMLEFTVVEDTDKVLFMTKFVTLGDNPWNGPNGYSLQYVQVYVLTSNDNLPKNTTTLGPNVDIDPGWHFALLLAPGWGDTPVPDGERAALYYYNGTCVVQDTLFTVYVDENWIVASVDKSLLFDIENIDCWGYAVIVAGYDGYAYMKVRPVQPGDPGEWVFGGGDPDAIAAGVEPRAIDILAPDPDIQYFILSSYDVELGFRALVPIIPGMPPSTTETTVTTTTETPTTTETITETTTEYTTTTATTTPETTTTATITTTTTVETTTTEYTTSPATTITTTTYTPTPTTTGPPPSTPSSTTQPSTPPSTTSPTTIPTTTSYIETTSPATTPPTETYTSLTQTQASTPTNTTFPPTTTSPTTSTPLNTTSSPSPSSPSPSPGEAVENATATGAPTIPGVMIGVIAGAIVIIVVIAVLILFRRR